MKTLRGAVAVSAAVMLLVGCGADAEPKFEAEPSASPTSATPTPDEPEPWEEKSPDGAAAFVEMWVEQFSRAFISGDTGQVRDLAARDCKTCNGFVDLIDDVYERGGSIEGDPWRVRKTRTSGSPPDGMAAISADIFQPAQVVRRHGAAPLRTDPGEVTYLFELTYVDGWKLTGLTFQDEQ